jgi:HKD family nuclease
MSINDFLNNGFIAAAINKNHAHNSDFSPRLLTNDKKYSKKVLSSIIHELKTCEEFAFSVAFVTNGGVATLIQTLKELEEIGVKGRILVSKYQNFTQPIALQRILSLQNIDLRIAIQDSQNAEFHAKGYLFKKTNHWKFIVGSSNLTHNALSINKEWNLSISAKEEGILTKNILQEFDKEFENATLVTEEFLKLYKQEYFRTKSFIRSHEIKSFNGKIFQPNKMQKKALENLQLLRSEGKTKSILVSATGTGKTFLSAFDARMFNPKRLLFIVHRENIAKKSLETFKAIFEQSKTYGLYSGDSRDLNADFTFSTVQTLSRENHLQIFSRNHFDS